MRFAVDDDAAFRNRAEAAITALAARPGYLGGRLARAVDDPREWVIVTDWEGVGAWRRALSSYDVKVTATPLFAEARGEPSAYEVLYLDDGGDGGGVVRSESDRAPDADTAGPIP